MIINIVRWLKLFCSSHTQNFREIIKSERKNKSIPVLFPLFLTLVQVQNGKTLSEFKKFWTRFGEHSPASSVRESVLFEKFAVLNNNDSINILLRTEDGMHYEKLSLYNVGVHWKMSLVHVLRLELPQFEYVVSGHFVYFALWMQLNQTIYLKSCRFGVSVAYFLWSHCLFLQLSVFCVRTFSSVNSFWSGIFGNLKGNKKQKTSVA